MRYNKGWSWSQNRNYLALNVPKVYDYYMFVDFDVEFETTTEQKVGDIILRELEEKRPEALTGSLKVERKTFQSSNNTGSYSEEFFLNQVCRIYNGSLVCNLFPIPASCHWWDAASHLNLAETFLIQDAVLKSPLWTVVNKESSGYRKFFNYKVGLGQMQRNFLLFKEGLKVESIKINEIMEFKYEVLKGLELPKYKNLEWKRNSTIYKHILLEIDRQKMALEAPEQCDHLAVKFQKKFFLTKQIMPYYVKQFFKNK
jgi:hypothetical protein